MRGLGTGLRVAGNELAIVKVACSGRQGDGWPLQRCPRERETKALRVGDHVLNPPVGASWHDGQHTQHQVPDTLEDARTEDPLDHATDETRVWFASHATELVQAFADLYREQAEMYAAAASARTGP